MEYIQKIVTIENIFDHEVTLSEFVFFYAENLRHMRKQAKTLFHEKKNL